VLAVIGTWVLLEVAHALWPGGFTFDDPKMLVLAFVAGFFPPVVWQFIQALFKKSIGGFVLPSVEAKLPLNELDGLTIWHEARLQEEDIENVPNMATASIVDLMLNTRFSPERIIDWVDQAILFTYVGSDQDDARTATAFRTTLRALGIRTASALVASFRWAEKGSDFDRILMLREHPAVRTIVQSVQTNRNLGLINRWRGLTGIDWDEPTSAGAASLSGVH